MAVDRMQWGAEEWQFADLYMPDEESPFTTEHGIPCVMLIHGGFWKTKYGLELMKPIAEDLAEAGVVLGTLSLSGGVKVTRAFGWTHYPMFYVLGDSWHCYQELIS